MICVLIIVNEKPSEATVTLQRVFLLFYGGFCIVVFFGCSSCEFVIKKRKACKCKTTEYHTVKSQIGIECIDGAAFDKWVSE